MGIISAKHSGIENISLPYLSYRLKEERIKLGLSQAEFSKTLGVGLKTIRKIEQGDLSVNFERLTHIFNSLGLVLSVSDLITSPRKKNEAVYTKEEVLDVLKHIYPILKIRYKTCEFSLFGSYAKGSAKGNSDIDILIEFEEKVDLEEIGEIQIILENLFKGKKVDLTIKSNLYDGYKNEIEESKINVI